MKALLFALAIVAGSLQAETVKLTSLDWPPYTSEAIAMQGASVAVAKAAFEAVGIDLQVEFFPWKRAVAYGKDNPEYDGYFPEYYAESLKQDFILSAPMGNGPLGFAQSSKSDINWSSLNDLKKYRIGTVSGYVNTAEFDAMAQNKELNISEASSDLKNLQKLLAGRVDLAVIDKNVMTYLVSTESELKGKQSELTFNTTPLENKDLYICFKKNNRGQQLAEAFNEGLGKIDVAAIMNDYFPKL